ncbi:hypothetical protein NHX12_024654 [Muraenolepis orangiensis]|uniref:Aquaporin 8 n=1 Tax=Muraenolepis orangiensis TaxID=630683 RepID=A0A9Q0IRI7_9TELE|nr:hypothetical protein NHX12_024654 [Muraenolepis orangiensis]
MGLEKIELEKMETVVMVTGEEPAPVPRVPNRYEKVFQPCLVELLGTMFFVFFGCTSVIENVPGSGRLQPALVHGLLVFVLVAVMDKISGSHFNPPFTLAIYLCGGMELVMVGPYLASQLIGGVLGAAMSKVMTPADHYLNTTGAAFDILKSEKQLPAAIFAEVSMTCLITLVVLMVAVNTKTKTPLGPILGGRVRDLHEPGPGFRPSGGALIAAALLRLLLGDEKMRLIMK